MDPGSTAGRASTHGRLIMLYWVIMNLVTHVSLNLEAKKEEAATKKEGDEEQARAWKYHEKDCRVMHRNLNDHSDDCRLMHRKVDQIASRLGITLYRSGMEHQTGGGPSRKASGRGMERACSRPPQGGEDLVQIAGSPRYDPFL